MSDFATKCASRQHLRNLHTITLTTQTDNHTSTYSSSSSSSPDPILAPSKPSHFFDDLRTLLHTAPLTHFQIYSSEQYADTAASDSFFRELAATHGGRLKRFSIHRMLICLDIVHAICRACVHLEQLFIVVAPHKDLVSTRFFPFPILRTPARVGGRRRRVLHLMLTRACAHVFVCVRRFFFF